MTTTSDTQPSRSLALSLFDTLDRRIASGQWAPGSKLPTEAQCMAEFGVSRTVVREALSKLQAAGRVQTRHGIGSFVVGSGSAEQRGFRIDAAQLATLDDVIAMLELRIGVETEAAALAALRRSPEQLTEMRRALDEFSAAVAVGRDAVGADFRLHNAIARATHNRHFGDLLQTLGQRIIPRSRLDTPDAHDAARQAYLRRVNAEHEAIVEAIALQDPEGARAAMRTHLASSRERRRRSAAAGG
ncbi:MAG: FadR/GntR family transcriptional regulator [Rubrivivax sp.]